jgi:PAS domain S-box-containing protein
MKIRSKLLLGNLVVALLVSILGLLAVNGIRTIDREYLELSNTVMPHQQSLQDIRYAASRMVSATIEYCFIVERKLRGGKVNEQLFQQETEQLHNAVVQLREAVARHERFAARSANTRTEEASLSRYSEALIASGNALVAAAVNHSLADIDAWRERYEDEEVAFFQVLQQTVAVEKSEVATRQNALDQLVSRNSKWILLIAVCVVIMTLVVGVGIAKAILGRIEQLRTAASRFAHDETPESLLLAGHDELRDLAEVLNHMAGDLRSSQLEVAQGRDFLTDIINSMADSLVVVDPEGNILMVNAATHAMLGYDDELRGLPFAMIMPGAPLEETADRGILWNVERVYLAKSGTAIPVAFSCSVLWNQDNSLRGFVCVALDISQMKEAEAKLKRFADELQLNNEELRNFAYIVSHDLRAPLVNIRGFAGELQGQLRELQQRLGQGQGSPSPADQQWLAMEFWPESGQALDYIGSSVARMDGLIAGLLKLSRYGHRDLHPEEIDIRALVQGIVATLRHQLGERQATIRLGIMPKVVGDRTALEQIFANLLDNAVKYLEPGRPGVIQVDGAKSDGEVLFRISDNGRGIAPADLDKIFDIFRRAGRQDVPGEGMGLAYVRTLVKRLEGQIWCESIQGTGTTFFVSLPRRDTQRAEVTEDHDQETA